MATSIPQRMNRRREQAEVSSDFYKENENDRIWWKKTDAKGEWLFSFDQKKIYNMFADFPQKLTKEEVKIFIKEQPEWADFFKDRLKDYL